MIEEKYYPGHPFIEAIIQDALKYEHILIDNLCGIGGMTDGFERTGKWKTIAAINHWPIAIETHRKNNPLCLHILEDFRTADLSLVEYMVNKILSLKPSIRVHGANGIDCTNFSNAKGGQPRDADSRTLAEHLDRYVLALNYDTLWIENVREFLMWGPMIPKIVWETIVKGIKRRKTIHFNPDKHDESVFHSMPGAYCPLNIKKKKNKVVSYGKWEIPDPEQKGIYFRRWRKHIESLGYESEYRLLNAADFGVPQHRIRLIMQFNRIGIPAYWPKPTHNKKGLNGLPKWNAIGPCLDLEDEGTDLLSFKTDKKTGKLKPRITSPKTIQRLIKGTAIHALINGEHQYITKYMGNNEDTGINNGKSINDASTTLPTSNRVGIVTTRLVDYYFGKGYTKSEHEAAGVTGTKDGAAVHTIQMVSEFRNNGQASSIQDASKAIVTKDKFSLDTVRFLDVRYSSGRTESGMDEKSPAVVQNPKQVLMNIQRYIMDTQFNNDATSLNDTSRTITANRKYYYIINCAWFDGHSKPISEASATLIASQHKMPQYLVVTETGQLAIEVYPHDPPHYRAFKRFMADYGIISVKMRMLTDIEMLRIQSFNPEKTKLSKNITHNKKMIGNAVPPELIEAIANAHYEGWKEFTEQKAAA